MAEQQQPTKPTPAKERVTTAARSVLGPKAFLTGLIAILVIILIVQNWALVRISVFGITFDLPGTLWYVLLFACGVLTGVLWLESRRRAQ
ncbi:MAG: hypothetical protein PVH68_04665 [Armatimonadota bacterium]